MIDEATRARLDEFLDELREDQYQFSDCESVGINTRGWTGDSPLKIAVVRGDVQIVAALLNAGADPNIIGEDGATPIHHAASHGHCEIIRLLLAHGASPEIACDLGTPTHLARHYPDAHALLTNRRAEPADAGRPATSQKMKTHLQQNPNLDVEGSTPAGGGS